MILSKKPNVACLIAIEVVLAISIIIILILSFIGYFSLQYGLRALTDVNANWQKSPIMEIVDAKGNCNAGYESFLDDEQWYGTVDGCDCVGRYSYRIPLSSRNKLNRYSCSWNMTVGGCASIRPVSPVKYKIWKGVNLCVKKGIKKFNDYIPNMVASSKECRSSYRQCGTMDSLGNILCVDQKEQCPVNKVVIQATGINPPKDYNYTMIPLGYNFNLFYTKDAVKNNIVLDLKLSEGPPCIDPVEKNTKYAQYVLDRNYSDYICKTKLNSILYDSRYVQLDTITKRDLFSQNGINPLLNYLPYFPYSSLDANVDLLNRPFIGWKQNCVNDPFYDPILVTVISDKIDALGGLKLAIIIFTFINMFYFFFQVVFKLKSLEPLSYNLLEIFFIVISFVILFLSLSCLTKSGNYSNQLESFNCGDIITNESFISIGKNLSSNIAYDRTIMILSLFNSLAYFLYIAFEFVGKICGKVNYYPETEQKLNNSITDYPTPYQNNMNGISYNSQSPQPIDNSFGGVNLNNGNNFNAGLNQGAPGFSGVATNNNLNRADQTYPSFYEVNSNNKF